MRKDTAVVNSQIDGSAEYKISVHSNIFRELRPQITQAGDGVVSVRDSCWLQCRF